MSGIRATWEQLPINEQLRRSSQSIASVGNKAFVFGGELAPREPRDSEVIELDVQKLHANVLDVSGPKPQARVGATMTAVHDKLYVFSGRGGVAMAPIDERGALQVFDTERSTWSAITPSDTAAAAPEPRSYHCATTDGVNLIFVHAGCPEKGRLRDLWSFDLSARSWRQHPDAPAAPRGGTSITYADRKLYRMNGFDGSAEIGGTLDVFDITSNTWQTIQYAADGRTGPGARSVSSLLATKVAGKTYLLTMFGEADPSSLGHAGAGKMLNDAWAFDTETRRWHKLVSEHDTPQPRGWFDASVVTDGKIVVSGGLADFNERIADAWLLTVSPAH